MTLNRWKILACSLTIGVGGLAVFATPPTGDKTEPPKEPAPLPTSVKPATPPTAADTPAPVMPVKAEEFELPSIPTPTADEKTKPTTEPVFEPIAPPAPLILKASGEDVKAPPVVVPSAPMIEVPSVKPIAPPVAPKNETAPPPAIDLDIPIPEVTKPAPPAVPPKPEVVTPPAPPTSPRSSEPPLAPSPIKPDPTPPVIENRPPPVVTPLPPSTPPSALKNADSAKLKMLLRMGDGQPRFEIRNTTTTDLLLKVYGEKIEMQAPPESRSSVAGVTAIGRVRFTAPGIEGTCDHLTILSATGEVLLKGNIRMKTKHGKTISEMTAEKMVYQIGTSGLATPSKPPVTPASYIPD